MKRKSGTILPGIFQRPGSDREREPAVEDRPVPGGGGIAAPPAETSAPQAAPATAEEAGDAAATAATSQAAGQQTATDGAPASTATEAGTASAQTETTEPETQLATDPETQLATEPETQSAEEPQTQAAREPEIEQAAEPATEKAAGSTADGTAGETIGPAAEPETPRQPATGPGLRNVDRKKVEDALLDLRKRIIAAPLPLEAPGVAEAKADRWKLLRQIDDYLLPRLRRPAAPILVALVGSTGAGKSTLVNSLVGKRVSTTGIRRPTTNSPVLACHPDDADWFAENKFLPTLPRVRQEGLARPGRDGLLVLAATEGMPRGIGLLDTPDIDSVVRAHYEFAHQFLDASDLWLFMTTAARYADAPAWELLRLAKERDAALGIVLARVPEAARRELVGHFTAMLEANGISDNDRFVIPETVVTEGMLPAEVYRPVREWLEEAATSEERREAVLTQTMSGVLDTFRTRVPALAGHVEAQVALRAELEELVDEAYGTSLAHLDEATANGSLLQGEVLARWQDFAGTGDLMRTLQARRSRGAKKHPRNPVPARLRALKSALRAALESLIVASGDRAAEDAVTRWRAHPAGAALFESVRESPDAGRASRGTGHGGGRGTGRGAGRGTAHDAERDPASGLSESSAGLARRAARAVSAWQDNVLHLVQAEGVTKRTVARAVPIDEEALAMVLQVGLIGYGTSENAPADGGAVPQRLLNSLFGAQALRTITAKARADFRDRIGLLFDEETVRFSQVADSAGVPDDTAAVQLYQATYSLETVR